MSREIALLIYGFVVLPLACIVLERLWPQVKGYRTLRAGLASDAVWYVVQSFVSRVVAPWVVFFALIPVLVLVGQPLHEFLSGFGPLATLPLPAQATLIFVAADFLGYWQHRLFHTRRFWPVHAVHHSSEALDWLSATRFHPLNEIGSQILYAGPLMAIGFSPVAFMLLAPFVATYQVLLHANINVSFGPARRLFASPIFHRWHHTLSAEAQNKNFSGFLPVWDLLFGTFYLPTDKKPSTFGTEGTVPAGFLQQLAYPFHAKDRAQQVLEGSTSPPSAGPRP